VCTTVSQFHALALGELAAYLFRRHCRVSPAPTLYGRRFARCARVVKVGRTCARAEPVLPENESKRKLFARPTCRQPPRVLLTLLAKEDQRAQETMSMTN